MEKLIACGWYFLIAAMTGDFLISLILPLFYKGYSITGMSISALGNPSSPVRIPFNIWMLIEGVLFLLALPSVYRRFCSVSGGFTVTMLIFTGVFAVGACIFTCFFSVNESKDVVTLASKIHGAGSIMGFMLFLFVPLLTAILMFKDNKLAMGVMSIVCFVLAIVFFILFIMADKPEFKGTLIGKEGLWQRLNLVFMYLPLTLVSAAELLR